MNSVTIRIPDSMRVRIEKLAAENGMKPTAFIRFAVAQLLNGSATVEEVPARHVEPVRPAEPTADKAA